MSNTTEDNLGFPQQPGAAPDAPESSEKAVTPKDGEAQPKAPKQPETTPKPQPAATRAPAKKAAAHKATNADAVAGAKLKE